MNKLLFSMMLMTSFLSFGQQRSCHTMDNHERLLMEDPHLFERMEKIQYSIPLNIIVSHAWETHSTKSL